MPIQPILCLFSCIWFLPAYSGLGSQRSRAPPPHHSTEMYWVSKELHEPLLVRSPHGRCPTGFMPPNGAAGSETSPRLRPIMPKSSRSENARPRFTSLVKT